MGILIRIVVWTLLAWPLYSFFIEPIDDINKFSDVLFFLMFMVAVATIIQILATIAQWLDRKINGDPLEQAVNEILDGKKPIGEVLRKMTGRQRRR